MPDGKRKRDVFWGLTERERLLARSLSESNSPSLIQFNLSSILSYDPNAKARLTDMADELNAVWNFIDFSKPGKKCHRGRRHFFLGEDGHANLALANQVVQAIIADKNAYEEKEIYVRAGDVDHEEIYASWARSVYETTGHLVKPVIIRESEMIARKYAEDFSPLASASLHGLFNYHTGTIRKEACRTLLLGFDHTGRTLLNVCLSMSRCIGPDKRTPIAFPITVVDMQMERWERYHQMAPEIFEQREKYHLDFQCMKVGSEDFEQWFRRCHQDFDRFVFCLPGDDFNIREALRIRDILIEEYDVLAKELIVRVANPAVNQFARTKEAVLPLKFFGNLSDIYSVAFMNGDPVDRIARVLNWQWNVNQQLGSARQNAELGDASDYNAAKERQDDIDRVWANADYYSRLSSRSSAMGGLSFFRLLGLECVLKEQTEDRPLCPIDKVEERIHASADVMARMEHLRWNTYLRSIGMRKWNLETPLSLEQVVEEKRKSSSFFIPNSLANQTQRFRAHAALTDFDELPKLDWKLFQAAKIPHTEHLQESDFIGQSYIAVNERVNTPSMQCKDYDIWKVFPKAALQAGFRFVDVTLSFTGTPQASMSPDTTSLARLWSAFFHSVKSFSRIWNCLFLLLRLFKFIISVPFLALERLCFYGKRYISHSCPAQTETLHLASEQLEPTLELANWIKQGYDNDVKPLFFQGKQFAPAGNFLKSNMIDWKEEIIDSQKKTKLTVFCFADSISPHSTLFTRSAAFHKTRFPYAFRHDTGLIFPFSSLETPLQRKILNHLDMRHRRMNFDKQPDFVAQLVCRDNDIFIQFRGTQTWEDWCENFLQFRHMTPPQFRLAVDLVRAVCETVTEQSHICLAGHSRGGGEVQYAVLKNATKCWKENINFEGITFNAQRLSICILKELSKLNTTEYAKEHIKNYRICHDLVSGWKFLGEDLIGPITTIGDPQSSKLPFLVNHSMDTFIRKLQQLK